MSNNRFEMDDATLGRRSGIPVTPQGYHQVSGTSFAMAALARANACRGPPNPHESLKTPM